LQCQHDADCTFTNWLKQDLLNLSVEIHNTLLEEVSEQLSLYQTQNDSAKLKKGIRHQPSTLLLVLPLVTRIEESA
jgi:hypothetical protein